MPSLQPILQAGKPVLIDFFAEWCGPCKTMVPLLREAKAALGDAATILKVDIDKNPGLAQQYSIQGVPTLILFVMGKPVWRASGVRPAAEIVRVVQQHAL